MLSSEIVYLTKQLESRLSCRSRINKQDITLYFTVRFNNTLPYTMQRRNVLLIYKVYICSFLFHYCMLSILEFYHIVNAKSLLGLWGYHVSLEVIGFNINSGRVRMKYSF